MVLGVQRKGHKYSVSGNLSTFCIPFDLLDAKKHAILDIWINKIHRT